MNTIVKKPLLSKKQKRKLLFLISIGTTLTIAYFIWWFQPSHIPNNFNGPLGIFDFILFLLLSYVVWHQIVNELFIWFVVLDMKKTVHITPEIGKKVAFLTAFVPGKEPYDVLENTLRAMSGCDYPHDTWVLDEGDDDFAKAICAKYDVKYFSRENIPYYNSPDGCFKAKTKAGNYNAWYDRHSAGYDFVAQVDVDFVPKKEFLTRTLGYFRDPNIAFVGSPQIYGNRHESLIARGAAEQAFSFYGTTQRGLFGKDMTLFIGANHVVRVAAHEDIEGYSGHIVEDHLTGMRFY
jgi:cellulose synthase/poly-beta-1,6-N-acetylglucosamine synthase-like glycosyltransferase